MAAQNAPVPQNLQVALSGLPAYAVKWNWPKEDGTLEVDFSFRLISKQRLLLPGVISTSLTEWGQQKWKFFKPEATIATRQLLIIRSSEGSGVLQWWDGIRDVTESGDDIFLPTIETLNVNDAVPFRDETAANYCLFNNQGSDQGFSITAIFDTQLEAAGPNGAFGGS